MVPCLQSDVIDKLFLHCLPLNWTHYDWLSQYRHTIASNCNDILWQCSKQAFRTCNLTYCEQVDETCMTFMNRVNGVEEKDEALEEWPRNIDWFDNEDYLISFTELLLEKAGAYAPEDGLLIRLRTFVHKEMPCSSQCTSMCTDELACPCAVYS